MSMKKIIRATAATVLILVLILPLRACLVSLGVMSIYSSLHEKESIMAQKGFEIEIPGGIVTEEKDWYPFVMTYHAGNDFGRRQGNPELDLTIMYNFPAFDLACGCSRLYDRSSPYYSSFYGAYVVSGGEDAFGFGDDVAMDFQSVAAVAEYDLFKLVLEDFGIGEKQKVFEWEAEGFGENVSWAGYEGWTAADIRIRTNGTAHQKKKGVRSYLQYGPPSCEIQKEDEFSPVNMWGRVYGRYFSEYECSIFFYILAADREVLESCDRKILSRASVS